jgi:hypothetical protein
LSAIRKNLLGLMGLVELYSSKAFCMVRQEIRKVEAFDAC